MQRYVGYGMSRVVRATGIISPMTPVPEQESFGRNPVFTSVGRNLKRIRIAAGMSQAELAFAAEINRTFVSEIERGLANPSLLTLATLCYVLQVTLSELFREVAACPPGLVTGRRQNAAKPEAPTRNRRLR
jgi:transcriptional regulator with XRE-family HTH domain